jgi:ABC-2 type transport system ATP-binding protein
MIEVDQLVKRFGAVTAVDGLTFTVRPGHVTGFLGPNGAGKTTTMRVILGLDAPTSGRATINSQRYTGLVRPLHQVGALLDATALHPGRTATAHLTSIAQSNGIGRRRVAEMLRLTGLEAVANRRLKGFSLGMKQRLGIAVALLGDPPVLMFDEPVNGLDTGPLRGAPASAGSPCSTPPARSPRYTRPRTCSRPPCPYWSCWPGPPSPCWPPHS